MTQFIPDAHFEIRSTPYFEDAHNAAIAGADLRKTLDYYQQKICNAVTRLNGFVVNFIPVHSTDEPMRYGYRLTFMFAGIRGQLDIAALPIRKETRVKKEKALKQALFLCWKELDAQADSWVYRPNSMPLLPYLIGNNGKTVTESLMSGGLIPDISPLQLRPGNK